MAKMDKQSPQTHTIICLVVSVDVYLSSLSFKYRIWARYKFSSLSSGGLCFVAEGSLFALSSLAFWSIFFSFFFGIVWAKFEWKLESLVKLEPAETRSALLGDAAFNDISIKSALLSSGVHHRCFPFFISLNSEEYTFRDIFIWPDNTDYPNTTITQTIKPIIWIIFWVCFSFAPCLFTKNRRPVKVSHHW